MADHERSSSSGSDPRARARLVAALDQAAEEWNRSWTMRVRASLADARPAVTVALVAILALAAAMAFRAQMRSTSADHGVSPIHRAALPVTSLTPGAVTSITVADLCSGVRPSRRVTGDVRDRVLRSYAMEGLSEEAYELDALITPELGGSTDARNLWPQRYASPVWNARVKDELEHLLPKLVCDGQVDLAVAQRAIASNWIAAYQHYFKTEVPLQAHVGAPRADDDDDLEILPTTYRIASR